MDLISSNGSLKSENLSRLWSEGGVTRGQRDMAILALKLKEEATSQGMRTASRSWKRRGKAFPPRGLQKRRQPCCYFNFRPETSDLQKCNNKYVCSSLWSFVTAAIEVYHIKSWSYFCIRVETAEALVPQLYMGSSV